MEDIHSYDYITQRLRSFFQGRKGFVEVPAQSRLSILAACEDPKTIAQFTFGDKNYPLPQTGQMWLEFELLKNPGVSGVFCQTTSYRNEPNPIPGRHDKIFPMFEFEAGGTIEDLKQLEKELLEFLGFNTPISLDYEELCEKYDISELSAEHEELIEKDFGPSISLETFPQRTHPFWNMKHTKKGMFNKVDILLYGMETIGSAERSTNIEEMKQNFLGISNGEYSKLLFDKFGEDRVMEELNNYLSLKMFPRFGGGIGVTRLRRAMKIAGLIK